MNSEELARRRNLPADFLPLPRLIPSIIPNHPPILSFYSSNSTIPLPSISLSTPRKISDDFEIPPQNLLAIFHGTQQPAVSSAFQDAGFAVAPRELQQQFNICWGHPLGLDFYKTLSPGQLCGQFPGSNAIGRKDTMGQLLREMKLKWPQKYQFVPQTWIIPDGLEEFREEAGEGFYIYKPAMASEGRGIELIKRDSELPKGLDVPAVIQEYMDNLLIINGFKFDIRLYVMVTSIDPLIFYIYDEGLGRFATHKYEKVNDGNFDDKTMHLTNFSINFKSDEFHMDGFPSKWKWTELLDYLDDNRQFFKAGSTILADTKKGAVKDYILKDVDELIIKTLIGVEPRMHLFSHNAGLANVYPRRNFGLYGFDIMFTEAGEALLVEINKSPSKNTKTDLDVEIKYPLMVNTLNLLGYAPAFHQSGMAAVPERFATEDEATIARFGGRLKSADCRQYRPFRLENGEQKHSFKTGADLRSFGTVPDLTRFERRVLWQLVDEGARLGQFRRLFPRGEAADLELLGGERLLNHLCCWFVGQADGPEQLRAAGL
ncbi:Tubulin tyrosine ligase [Spironucleus salmonicida]|uniref:Tubulin--tyrosine ligase-like protein 5 n=1 Tax=Spironucleus salmonicida TaxID=348837 RepID=V6LN00_9EUKA|nr:Tubulin tyrosine ligase [Spironucleus salmonicida]|eukprot:EST45598.1 Tubulin tyrosine ligase [Spironucleus salmonicida]